MALPALVTPDNLTAWRAGDNTLALEAAQATVRSYCRWHIAPSVTETVTVASGPGYLTMLPSLYVTEVLDVVIEAEVELPLVTPTGYAWSPRGYLTWPYLRTLDSTATVTFTHGYDETPADVAAVCLSLADDLASVFSGASQVSVDDATVTYGADRLSPAHRFVLDAYRLVLC